MITKTIGSGGDYATIKLALDALIAASPLADDYKFSLISDHTNTAFRTATPIKLNAHSVEIDLCGFTITEETPGAVEVYLNSAVQYTGTFWIHSGTINSVFGVIALLTIYLYADATPDSQRFICERVIFGGRQVSGLVISSSLSVYYYAYVYSCKFFIDSDLDGYLLSIQHPIGAGLPPPGFYGLTVENCTIFSNSFYKVGLGVYGVASAKIRNVVSFGSTWLDWEFENPGYVAVENCADSDNTLTIGTDNLHNITAADFVSVNLADSNFLKISTGIFGARVIADPPFGKKPLRVRFRNGIDYYGLSRLAAAGMAPEVAIVDLDNVAYAGDKYPIGCYVGQEL